MSEYVNFHYMPLEGKITGKQVLQQTEDAINDLGNKVYNLDVDEERIDEAIEKSEQAIETADAALSAVTTDRAVWKNTVAEMKATDIDLGVTAATRGKMVFNDGNGAFYGVRSEKSGDVESDDTVFLNNGNVAERIQSMNIIANGNNIIFVANVAELIDSDALIGNVYGTTGYYSANDGGAGLYSIRAKTQSDVDDGGSIIFLDNGNVAELFVGNTVYPQQFGAFCDREHDDSGALQSAVNYVSSKANGIGVTINKDMFIDDTITVPMNVDISADINSNRYPLLYIGSNCTTVFDCVSKQNSFNAIRLKPTPATYRSDLVGWDFHGDASNDVDSSLMNCGAQLMSKGVIVRGRNLRIYDCFFGHCQYGIYYDTTGVSNVRGCDIDGTRFHGIGEEEDLKFVNCSAIYVNGSVSGNLTIRNCIADQGGTFFDGAGNAVLIENNFVESFEKTLINVDMNNSAPAIFSVVGNILKGKNGSTTYGETVGYPQYIVSISNAARVMFADNALSYDRQGSIYLDNVTASSFIGNTFLNAGRDGANYRRAFVLKNCDVTIKNNVAIDSTVGQTRLCVGDSSNPSNVKVTDNIAFNNALQVNVANSEQFMKLYNGTFGTETTLTVDDLPDKYPFMIVTAYGNCIFEVRHSGSYFMGSSRCSYDGSHIYHVTVSVDNDTSKVTFGLLDHNTASNTFTAITNQTYELDVPY